MTTNANFNPNWTTPPGKTIQDVIALNKTSGNSLANLLKIKIDDLNLLINGNLEINEELAFKLSHCLGGTKEFWLERESKYRADLLEIESKNKVTADNLWAKRFPLGHLFKKGFISKKSEPLNEVLNYFSCNSIEEWHKVHGIKINASPFRTSIKVSSDEYSTIAWIRAGEIQADRISCSPWNKDKLIQTLPQIKELFSIKDLKKLEMEIKSILSACGVAYIIERGFPGSRASGVTTFIKSDKAMILQSGRYGTDDHFWFTLFHEIAHLILHSSDATFIEYNSIECQNHEIEIEANSFAQKNLIPDKYQEELVKLKPSYRAVLKFSKKTCIPPGIVVGQLQYKGLIPHNYLNKLKVKFDFTLETE